MKQIGRGGAVLVLVSALGACDSGQHGSNSAPAPVAVVGANASTPANTVGDSPGQLLPASAVGESTITLLPASAPQVQSGSASTVDNMTAVKTESGALSLSADGKTAAYVRPDGGIVIWDPVNMRVQESLPTQGQDVNVVALSPDGKLLAIGYADAQIFIWSRPEHKSMRQLKGTASVLALAFSPDGHTLASGGLDGVTRVWDVATGRQVYDLDAQYGVSYIGMLGFTGDGRGLLIGERYADQYQAWRGATYFDLDEGIEIWARLVPPSNNRPDSTPAGQALGGNGWLLAHTGNDGLMVTRLDRCVAPQQLPFGAYADTVSADPLGRWVMAGVPNGEGQGEQLTFSNPDGKQTYTVMLSARAIALVPQADGRSMFAITVTEQNGNIVSGALQRIEVPPPLLELPPVSIDPHAVHCRPSEALRKQQDFRIPERPPELETAAQLPPPEGRDRSSVVALYFSGDGKLYSHYDNPKAGGGGAALWDAQSRRLLQSHFDDGLQKQTYRMRDGWWSTNGKSVAVSLLTGKPAYPAATDRQHARPYRPGNPSFFLVADPDTGEMYWLAAGHIERYGADGKRLGDVKMSGKVISFGARNGRLAVLYANGDVQMWPLQPAGKSRTFKLNGSLNAGCEFDELDLSPDGRYMRTSVDCTDAGGIFLLYDLTTGKFVTGDNMLAPFPSRSNRIVVADARPNHVAVWDLGQGAIMARLPRLINTDDQEGHHPPPKAAISDDGRLLAEASNDGLIRLWNLDSRQLLGEGHAGAAVTAMAFDPKSQQLAVGTTDAKIMIIRVPNRK